MLEFAILLTEIDTMMPMYVFDSIMITTGGTSVRFE